MNFSLHINATLFKNKHCNIIAIHRKPIPVNEFLRLMATILRDEDRKWPAISLQMNDMDKYRIFYSKNKITWLAAEEYCNKENGDLTSIHSREEMENIQVYTLMHSVSVVAVYIGLHNKVK